MPRRRNARSSSFELDSSSGGQQVRQHLDDRDLGAERAPDAGELDADHAAAEDDRRRGHPVQLQRVVAGDDPLAVDLQAGQAARLRAGGQHHVRALDDAGRRPAPGSGRSSGPRPRSTSMCAAGDQAGQALPQPGDDLVLVGVDAGHVDAVEGGPDAEVGALPGLVGDLGRVQQRLGRDAAAVQAGAADLVLLDQRDTLAQLGRAQRAGVAAAAAAENDDVVAAAVRHVPLLVRSTQARATPSSRFSRALIRRPARPLEPPVGDVQRDLHERPDRRAGPALGGVAVRLALVERRAGDVEMGPAYPVGRRIPAGTARPTSMPPFRSAVTLAMSATVESRPLRSSSGSGIGHAGLAGPAGGVDHAVGGLRRRWPSRRLIRVPSATSCAPVSVATSTSRSGESCAGPGQRVGQHQAALGVGVQHLDGLAAVDRDHVGGPLGACRPACSRRAAGSRRRSPSGRSAATACSAPSTAAAPPMSDFIVSIDFGGLSDRPPESKVMPLPANTTVLVASGWRVAEPDQPRRVHRALADADEAAVAAVGQRLLVQHLDVQAAVAGAPARPPRRRSPGTGAAGWC